MNQLMNRLLSALFGGIWRRVSDMNNSRSPVFWSVVSLVIAVGIGLPIYMITECTGFRGSVISVTDCALSGPFFRKLTEFFIGVYFFSFFLFGIPIVIYVGAVLFAATAAGTIANSLLTAQSRSGSDRKDVCSKLDS